jgi:NCAIR mutase (PurE)-related protein
MLIQLSLRATTKTYNYIPLRVAWQSSLEFAQTYVEDCEPVRGLVRNDTMRASYLQIMYIKKRLKKGLVNKMDVWALLEGVKEGSITVETAAEKLKDLPYEDVGFARIDHHRQLRIGFPEVIFCQGKKTEQITLIVEHMLEKGGCILATRADEKAYFAVREIAEDAIYNLDAKTILINRDAKEPKGLVVICTGGTADIPVAEEAAVTAEAFGCKVERIYDVGVAGIHRLLGNLPSIRKANVVIAVAGMEGALAGVVSGLVDSPVIGVPTSIGYGASFGGVSALLTMLNSCSPILTMNIDNGFGAGYMAALINRLAK